MAEPNSPQAKGTRVAIWVAIFAALGLLLALTEDLFRSFHPIGILEMLGGKRLRTALIDILILLVFSSLPGGAIGLGP
ncbi:MAG: hypothetical protein ACREQA_14445 [Candidatus Binatia bacterium]